MRELAFSPADRRQLVRLLGELQGHLQTVITSATNADGEVVAVMDAKPVARARRLWRTAEKWVSRLEAVR